ncbi:MAG: hypothetical protein AB7F75_11400, partial [Planctomycetota bacterium]
MKKSIKWGLIGVGSAFTLVVGTVLAHPMWLPSVAAHFASEALGKPVAIRSLSLSYSLPLTVTLGGLEIPGAITLESLSATADPLAAMDGTFTVPDVTLRGLKVDVEGLASLKSPASSGAGASQGESPQQLPKLPTSLLRLKIDDAQINAPGAKATWKTLSLAVDTSVEGTASLALELGKLTATDASGRSWPLASVNVKADAALQSDAVDLRNFSLESPGLGFHAAGKATKLFSELPTIDITLSGNLDFKEVNAALSTAGLTLPVTATGSLTHSIKVGTQPEGDLTLMVQLDPKGLKVSEGSKALLNLPDQPLTLSGGCSLKGGKVGRPHLKALSVPWEFLKLQGDNIEVPSLVAAGGVYQLSSLMNLNGQMNLSTDVARVISDYAPILKGMVDASGKLEAALSLKGDGATQTLEITSMGSSLRVKQGGNEISEEKLDNHFKATLSGSGESHSLTFENGLDLAGLGAKGTVKGRITNLDAVLAGRLLESPDNSLVADFTADLGRLERYGVSGLQGDAKAHVEVQGTAGKGHFKVGADIRGLAHAALKSPADITLELEGDSRMEGDNISITELQRLSLRGPGGLDVSGSLSVESAFPAKPESLKAKANLQGTLPTQEWLSSQMPGVLPPGLTFGVPTWTLKADHG